MFSGCTEGNLSASLASLCTPKCLTSHCAWQCVYVRRNKLISPTLSSAHLSSLMISSLFSFIFSSTAALHFVIQTTTATTAALSARKITRKVGDNMLCRRLFCFAMVGSSCGSPFFLFLTHIVLPCRQADAIAVVRKRLKMRFLLLDGNLFKVDWPCIEA